MKILLAEQVRQADKFTIENEPVASIDLMERAANAFVTKFINLFPSPITVKIICGMGNNGGDGLAIARMLHHKHFFVEVFLLKTAEKGSPDYAANLQRLMQITSIPIHTIQNKEEIIFLGDDGVIIDALWGTGLTRPVEGLGADLIRAINDSGAEVVAVDMPSGLPADSPPAETVVEADYTITFEIPKLSLLLHQNEKFTGRWIAAPIGLSPEFITSADSPYELITEDIIRKIFRKRGKFSHKGTFGHCLIAGGSYGKMGAVALAARAAIRSGAGLVTTFAPRCGYEILQISAPEAMAISAEDDKTITGFPSTDNFDSIAVGPGMGTKTETAEGFYRFLAVKNLPPLVLDADALNLLSHQPQHLKNLPHNTILTPHPGEFKKFYAEDFDDDYQRLQLLMDMAHQYQIYIILKGAHTAVATPAKRCFFNSTGNAGMATGGAGDTLTGIVAAFLAQEYSAEESCILSVFFHGLAGDFAAETKGVTALTAGDIIENLGNVYKRFE